MSSDDETGLYALPLAPSAPMRELKVGYPDDYADPEWDGSEEQYREVVVPARMDALRQSFDAALAGLGFPQLRWEWQPPRLVPDGILTYDMVLPTWPDDTVTWTPLRSIVPRVYDYHVGGQCPRMRADGTCGCCYRLRSGNMVHVKPGCRC